MRTLKKTIKAEVEDIDVAIVDVKDDEASDNPKDEEKKPEDKATEADETKVSKENKSDEDDQDSNEEEDGSDDDDEEDDLQDQIRRRQLRAVKNVVIKFKKLLNVVRLSLFKLLRKNGATKAPLLPHTYPSRAGIVCLCPITTNGGGISRKIANHRDRKQLKSVMSSLDVPTGMGCIIRTAGLKRTKTEIKRDFDYLIRIWNGIRNLTLESVAPATIYNEGNLIKRSIRDLYGRNIDEILVEGEEGFNTARDFMKILMPTHAKKVVHYKNQIPLYQRYQVETQLESMFNPNVTLKSGGYLVINPTEALIAIDVNSGKATRQHNIEETAISTNLEAAAEIGRQLRLRDMGWSCCY